MATTKKQSELISQLSKVQKFYIEGHKSRDLKVLAKDIGSKVACVRAYLSYLNKRDKRKAEKAEEASKEAQPISVPITSHIRADSLMMKKRGTVIMTPESSQLGDVAHKRSTIGPKLAQNIQKIRPE